MGTYLGARSSVVVGNLHRADPVTVDVEQKSPIVEVTAHEIGLGLEVHASRHNPKDPGQFASAVIAVERRVIKADLDQKLHWRRVLVKRGLLAPG